MEKFESAHEQERSMPCASTEKKISDLENEGWEYELSFHTTIPEQWDSACDRVEDIVKNGFWEPILVQGQNDAERRDGVAYIYKKKTEKFEEYEKDMGHAA